MGCQDALLITNNDRKRVVGFTEFTLDFIQCYYSLTVSSWPRCKNTLLDKTKTLTNTVFFRFVKTLILLSYNKVFLYLDYDSAAT